MTIAQLLGGTNLVGAGTGAGLFTGSIIPGIGFTVIAPEPLFDKARWKRVHRKVMRDVLHAVLWEWHQKILPEHFKPAAKTKYRHKKRQESTRRIKQARRKHNIDLVDSGKTRRSMQTRLPKVTFQGKADLVLTAKMKYKFPFRVSRNASDPRHVSIAQMAKEIATWSDQDIRWATKRIAELYAKEIEHALASQPKKMRQARAQGLRF